MVAKVTKELSVPTKSVSPARPKKSQYIGICIDEQTRIVVERFAARRDLSMSRVMRDALREYLERHKSQAA